MSNSIFQKTIVFDHFKAHMFYFKQKDVSELDEVFDEVYEQVYATESEIVGLQAIAPNQHFKNFDKTLQKVFGDINWIVNRLNTGDKEKVSGVFIAISGCTIKTLLANKSILKLFEVANSKVSLVGSLNNDEASDSDLEKNLIFTGLTNNNIIFNNSNSVIGNYNVVFLTNYQGVKLISEKNLINIRGFELGNSTFIKIESAKSKNTEEFRVFIKEQLDAINVQLESRKLEWRHLIKALFIVENKQQLKLIKSMLKDYKIPLSVTLFAESNNSNELLNFKMNFANGTERKT